METVFECEFTPTVRMIAHRVRKLSPLRCIIMVVLGIGYALYVLPKAIEYRFAGMWALFALFSIAVALYCLFLPEIRAFFSVKQFEKDTSADGIYRVVLGDHIEVRQGKIRTCLEYSEINQVSHLKYTYELRKNKRMAVMLDPKAFTKGTFEEFKKFLREKRPDLVIPE